MTHLPTEEKSRHRDSYGALRFRDFRLLLGSAFLMMFAQQMLTVAIGWELYNRTGSALVLGGIGLAQVIPLIILFLPAGYAADNVSRKYILIVTQTLSLLASLGLATLSFQRGPLPGIYGCLFLLEHQSSNGELTRRGKAWFSQEKRRSQQNHAPSILATPSSIVSKRRTCGQAYSQGQTLRVFAELSSSAL